MKFCKIMAVRSVLALATLCSIQCGNLLASSALTSNAYVPSIKPLGGDIFEIGYNPFDKGLIQKLLPLFPVVLADVVYEYTGVLAKVTFTYHEGTHLAKCIDGSAFRLNFWRGVHTLFSIHKPPSSTSIFPSEFIKQYDTCAAIDCENERVIGAWALPFARDYARTSYQAAEDGSEHHFYFAVDRNVADSLRNSISRALLGLFLHQMPILDPNMKEIVVPRVDSNTDYLNEKEYAQIGFYQHNTHYSYNASKDSQSLKQLTKNISCMNLATALSKFRGLRHDDDSKQTPSSTTAQLQSSRIATILMNFNPFGTGQK